MATIVLKAKSLKFQYIKLDKIEKIELPQHKICQIQHLDEPVDIDEKKGNFVWCIWERSTVNALKGRG